MQVVVFKGRLAYRVTVIILALYMYVATTFKKFINIGLGFLN